MENNSLARIGAFGSTIISLGAGDKRKIPLLDSTGKIDSSCLPGEGTEHDAPTVITLTGSYVLAVPGGTPSAGDQVKYYATASGADHNFKVNSAIKIPSDTGYDNSVGKTMTSGKTYIVQIEYMGSFWALTTLVGGFSA